MNELEIINQIITVLTISDETKQRYAADIESLVQRREQYKKNKFRLGVIGVTSSGKSTMINSFLGERLLPAVARPSSNQLVSCYKGSNRFSRVLFSDDSTKEYKGENLNSHLIERYADEGFNAKNKEKVKYIEIISPKFPFPEEIILVDSPGLDAMGYDSHEQLTMNSLLPTVDFCIFLTTCKTNSDDKMKNVLNVIAEYDKPVIIVQNMIDSLKQAPDGSKSVIEVAQDHIKRIERIIEKSNIKDKSMAKIVQISAIWALEARTENSNKENKKLLIKSNYDFLVSTIMDVFKKLRPRIENHRLISLKKVLDKIQKEAEIDGKGEDTTNLIFEFDGYEEKIEEKFQSILDLMKNKVSHLQSVLGGIKDKNNISESFVEDIKKSANQTESDVIALMKECNSYIEKICMELNVDSRNIFSTEAFDKVPELKLKTTTKSKKIKESGFAGGAKRFFGGLFSHFGANTDNWGWVEIKEAVTDIAETKKSAENFVSNTLRVITQTCEKWEKSISIISNKLISQIENRRKSFEDRKEKALSRETYKIISKKLASISKEIKIISTESTTVVNDTTNIKTEANNKVEISHTVLNIYKLAENIKKEMNNSILRLIYNFEKNNTYIIGWDKFSELFFIRNNLCQEIKETDINDGRNKIGRYCLIHNPKEKYFLKESFYYNDNNARNIFILVNATQFGAALKQIDTSKITDTFHKTDNISFVIQDFNEIIIGNSVEESISNMKRIGHQLAFKNQYHILLQHENPLYNLLSLELQKNGYKSQSDEVNLIHQIQESFPYLRTKVEDNIIDRIIKSFASEDK